MIQQWVLVAHVCTAATCPEGPIASIESVAEVGGNGLVLALAIAVPLSRDPQRAKVGAIVLGAPAIITLPVFWSGAPASLGASAAWPGGLARGSSPRPAQPRLRHRRDCDRCLEIVATVFGGAAGRLLG